MHTSSRKKQSKNKLGKKSSILMSVLPLAACGGGGTPSSGGGTPAPAPTPPAEFLEESTNVFVARDNRDTTLAQGDSTEDLTVTGKGGDDIIRTGEGADVIDASSGNDIIRSGEGADTVDAGSGNDAIVVIGTTTAGQYTNSDITNAGNGYDLSGLITLADLNDRSVSEVAEGETLDGGSGTNTLFIYGDVDLTGVTISNLTILEVHSNVILTPEQIAAFTTIDGDGNSVINIQIPEGSSDNYILDLSVIDVSNIGTINIDGDITVKVSSAEDFGGIAEITATGGSTVKVEVVDGGSDTSIDLDDIAATFDQVDEIILDDQVTLTVNNPTSLSNIELGEISGSGTIETDGSSSVDTALDGITIDPAVNGIPHAEDDTDTAGENETILVDVLANDSDIDNDSLSLTSVSVAPGNGSVSIVDGKVEFNPGADFDDLDDEESRDVTVSYTVTDGSDSADGTLVITVNGSNDAPTVVADTGSAFENVNKSFDVLNNDSDVEEDTLTITAASVDNAGQGSVSIVEGELLFNPGTDFDDLATGATEEVDISYTVSDGDDTTNGTLKVTVTGVNDAPVVVGDSADADENETILIDVLANDTDEENDELSITNASVPNGQGSVRVVDGKIEFNPGTDFDDLVTDATEDVTITYTISDGNKSDQGSVTVTVAGINDAPVASNDDDEILNTETTTVDVLANDEDEENDSLTISNVDAPAGKGTASIVDGKIHFDPGSDFDGLEPAETEDVVITYTVSDGDKTDTATLTITVVGPNEAPVTTNDTATAGENETILVDVLANDTDADGHELTISDVSVDEGKGSVRVVDGKVEFNPGTDFDYLKDGESTEVEVSYSADDGIDETGGTLTITVNGVSDDPVTVSDEADVYEGEVVIIDVLSNDSDPEGGELSLVSASADKGTVIVNGDYLVYTAADDDTDIGYGDTGTATITYVVSGLNGISEGTVEVSLYGKNDNPETTSDTAELFEGSSTLIDVLANDTDVNGDNLTLYNVSVVGDRGQASISGDKINFDTAGDFNYLDFGESQTVTINYTTVDGYGGYADGTVTVTVDGTNDTDVAENTNYYVYLNEPEFIVYFPEQPVAGTFKNPYLYKDTYVYGWEFNDTITTGSGNDYIDGYDGADTMDGGEGLDILGYTESTSGVTVNLATGHASGGFATGDVFYNFEAINGSDYLDNLTGDDQSNGLYGYAGNDNLIGGAGDDWIDGGTGRDTIDGGEGVDLASYAFSLSGVTVNLTTGYTSGGEATGDTLIDIEEIWGSSHADTLTGDENDNLLIGDEGKDTLYGMGGNDRFAIYDIDGSIEDTIDGGTGFDGIFFYGTSSEFTVDFSTLDVSNIEFISTYPSRSSEKLIISAQDVIDMTDEYNELLIFADHNDSVVSSDSWTYLGDDTDGENTFSVYQSGEAKLIIYHTIGIENIGLGQSGVFLEVSRGIWEAADDTNSMLYQADNTLNITVTGKGGDDIIFSGSGDSTIDGGAGADFIDAGAGRDKLLYENSDAAVTVSLDTGRGTGGHAEGDIISGIEDLYGSDYDDHLTGNDENNYVVGGDGNDTLYGLGGDDYLFGGAGINVMYGGEGNDTFVNYGDHDTVYGGDGNDIINIDEGVNIVDGGAGFDEINFSVADTDIEINFNTGAMSGNFTVGDTYTNIEKVVGSQNNDTFIGDDNDNVFDGYWGNDTLIGGEGADELIGDRGSDTIYGDEGDDVLDGGDDNDIIYGGIGHDDIDGGRGDDVIEGQDGNDTINGNYDNDTIYGQAGNDVIIGGYGNDILSGGEGTDDLDGSYGDDKLEFSDLLDTYDGGFDIDTLFTNVQLDISLSELTISNIEIIDLDNSTADSIEFTFEDMRYLADYDVLTFDGTSADTVTSTGQGWVQGEDRVINGQTYHSYDLEGEGLLIHTDIIQDIS